MSFSCSTPASSKDKTCGSALGPPNRQSFRWYSAAQQPFAPCPGSVSNLPKGHSARFVAEYFNPKKHACSLRTLPLRPLGKFEVHLPGAELPLQRAPGVHCSCLHRPSVGLDLGNETKGATRRKLDEIGKCHCNGV